MRPGFTDTSGFDGNPFVVNLVQRPVHISGTDSRYCESSLTSGSQQKWYRQ